VEISVKNITKFTNKSSSSRAKGTVPFAIIAGGSLQLQRSLPVYLIHILNLWNRKQLICSQNDVLSLAKSPKWTF